MHNFKGPFGANQGYLVYSLILNISTFCIPPGTIPYLLDPFLSQLNCHSLPGSITQFTLAKSYHV